MLQAAAHENNVLPKVTAAPRTVRDAAFPNADNSLVILNYYFLLGVTVAINLGVGVGVDVTERSMLSIRIKWNGRRIYFPVRTVLVLVLVLLHNIPYTACSMHDKYGYVVYMKDPRILTK